MFPMMFLSGSFFPLEMMPGFLLKKVIALFPEHRGASGSAPDGDSGNELGICFSI
jgi:hypothetical protein